MPGVGFSTPGAKTPGTTRTPRRFHARNRKAVPNFPMPGASPMQSAMKKRPALPPSSIAQGTTAGTIKQPEPPSYGSLPTREALRRANEEWDITPGRSSRNAALSFKTPGSVRFHPKTPAKTRGEYLEPMLKTGTRGVLCKADAGHTARAANELTVNKGDLILVIKFEDPSGIPGDCDWVSVVHYTKRGRIPSTNLSKVAPQPEDTSFMWLPKGYGDSDSDSADDSDNDDANFGTSKGKAAPPVYNAGGVAEDDDDGEDEVLGGFNGESPERITNGGGGGGGAAATSTPAKSPAAGFGDDEVEEEVGGGFGGDDGNHEHEHGHDEDDEDNTGFGRVTPLDVSNMAADGMRRSNSGSFGFEEARNIRNKIRTRKGTVSRKKVGNDRMSGNYGFAAGNTSSNDLFGSGYGDGSSGGAAGGGSPSFRRRVDSTSSMHDSDGFDEDDMEGEDAFSFGTGGDSGSGSVKVMPTNESTSSITSLDGWNGNGSHGNDASMDSLDGVEGFGTSPPRSISKASSRLGRKDSTNSVTSTDGFADEDNAAAHRSYTASYNSSSDRRLETIVSPDLTPEKDSGQHEEDDDETGFGVQLGSSPSRGLGGGFGDAGDIDDGGGISRYSRSGSTYEGFGGQEMSDGMAALRMIAAKDAQGGRTDRFGTTHDSDDEDEVGAAPGSPLRGSSSGAGSMSGRVFSFSNMTDAGDDDDDDDDDDDEFEC